TVHILRTTFLWRGTAFQRIGIRNHGSQRVALRLALRFDSDFADLFEVRGLKRAQRGTASRSLVQGREVMLNYHGLDAVTRRSAILFDPHPLELSASEARYECVLAPGEITRVFIAVGCDTLEDVKTPFARALIGAHRERRAASCNIATVESSNVLLNEV